MPGPVYDTGLTRAQRTLLRATIAAQLSDLLVANGGYLHAIRSLPRPLKNSSEEELGWIGYVAQGQYPMVLIALGSKSYESVDVSAVYRGKIEVSIYACSGNIRGVIDGRLETDVVAASDATKDPGIDTILEHVEERLLGQGFELGNLPAQRTTHMDPESEEELVTGGDCTVWEQKYSLYVMREVNPDRKVTQLNLTMEAQTSIEPTSDPENPLVDTVANLEAP